MNVQPNNMTHFQTINIHRSDVNSVAFGRNFILASGSSDKKVYVYHWIKEKGYVPTSFSPLTSHTYGITCLEFSPFGTILATASVDGITILWDAMTGEKLHAFVQPGNSPIRSCRFSSNTTYLVSAGDTGAVYLWDVSKKNLHKSLIAHEESVFALSFAPEGNYLVSGCSAGILNLWDGQSSGTKPIATVDCAHDLGVTSIDFASEVIDNIGGFGKICLLASAGNDQVIRLWNVYLGLAGDADGDNISIGTTDSSRGYGAENYFEELRTFTGHSGAVMSVRCYGNLLASSSGDKTIRVWEMSGKCLKILENHQRYVTSVDFSKGLNPLLLASGSNDKSVMIWDLSGGLSLEDDLQNAQNEFTLTPETLWNQYEKVCKARLLQEKEEVVLKSSFTIPKADFNSCAIVSGGHENPSTIVVAGASSSRKPYAWDLQTSAKVDLGDIVNHKYGVNFIDYSPHSELIASASLDGSCILFNVQEKRKIGTIINPSGLVLRICKFSPDGSYLLLGGDDEKATLWNISFGPNGNNFTLVKEFIGHESSVRAVAFTPDGQYCITGSVSGKLKLWECNPNASSEAILHPENGHELGVTTCEFSPKGLGGHKGRHKLLLATGGNDALIKLWQVYIGLAKETPKMHQWKVFTDHGTANILSVSFSPSGKLLATGAGDHFIRIFEISSGNCIEAIEGHERFVTAVSFAQNSINLSGSSEQSASSSGSCLISCSNDYTVKVWQLSGSLAMESATLENVGIENLISSWSVEDVIAWLAEIGQGKQGQVFEEQGINGERLIQMNEAFMINQMNIDDETVRKQIMAELQWLKVFGTSSNNRQSEEQNYVDLSDVRGHSSRPVSAMTRTIVAPVEFFCPITHDIMVEPVTATDGRTYERAAITEYFLTGKTSSPVTNEELVSLNITPNFDLQNQISEFLQKRLRTS